MIKPFRVLLIPVIAVAVTLLTVWYVHLPSPLVTASMAQVIQEAKDGGYRLIDMESLSERFQTDRGSILLVDTRQEWEHRAGHIAGSVNFSIAPIRNFYFPQTLNEIKDGLKILFLFRRQTDHKIKFNDLPSQGKSILDSISDFLLADIFVDHIAQALTPSFRCNRHLDDLS